MKVLSQCVKGQTIYFVGLGPKTPLSKELEFEIERFGLIPGDQLLCLGLIGGNIVVEHQQTQLMAISLPLGAMILVHEGDHVS